MIPVSKLKKLPRSQRLRKIWKIFAGAENSIVLSERNGEANHEKTEYYCDILEFLAADEEFRTEAREAIEKALAELRETRLAGRGILRRPLNDMRHLLLAETGRSPADWDLLDPEGKLDPAQRRPFPGMMLYLEDIRSPFNVGAMFRTAESFGAEKLFLSPLCAAPDHKRALRSAMGCVEILPWERLDFSGLTAAPYTKDLPVFALETGGVPLEDFLFPPRGIMIAGSEELGVSPRLLAAADSSLGRVSIPCYGVKGSLNVSVAFGIVMCAWARSLSAK